MLGIYLFSVEKDSEELLKSVQEKSQKNVDYIAGLLRELQDKNDQLVELSAKLTVSECKPKKKCCKKSNCSKDKGI